MTAPERRSEVGGARAAIRVERASAADRARWDAFVEARPEADVLQTWAWGDVTEPSGERPVRLVARRGDEVVGVAAILVRASVAGRAVGYVPHGPVWRRDDPDADAILRAMMAGIRRAGREERAIVVKADPRAVPGEDAAALATLLANLGLRRSPHDLQARTTRIVALNGGGDALRAGWDTKARSRVRRAAEAGVEVVVHRGPDGPSLRAFHEFLAATARNAGFRTHDLAHFERIAAALAPDGRWYQAVTSYEGRVLGSVVTPRLGDRAYYLYGATAIHEAPETRDLFPAYAGLAGAMDALAADGVATLDLWGVAEPGDEGADPSWAGFSEFKRHFRGEPLAHPGTWDLVVSPAWNAVRTGLERVRDARASGRGGGAA
ncbi:MAG TPA: peptidoglycan bridge formation glycyltransferase FemA/FemB family protein [Candidatus Limnocylindrales bacterium]